MVGYAGLVYLAVALIFQACLSDQDQSPACQPCNCFISNPQEVTADCANTGLKIPPLVPPTTTILLFSANDLSNFKHWEEKTPFSYVHHLKLDRNALTADSFVNSPFIIFPNLVHLDLSENQLQRIPETLPLGLRVLILSKNIITTLRFPELLKLEELYLDGNAINIIDADGFIPLGQLDSPPSGMPNLKKLEMSSNSIGVIDDQAFTAVPNLEALSLARNEISVVTKKTYQPLRHLQYLDLSYNMIDSIQNQTFKALTKLTVLYLNNNRLQTLPFGLPFLDWADFSNNVIRRVNESESKKDIYPVEVFNLAGNPLHCDCHLVWLKELWDRREYVLKYSEVLEPEEFVPTCESPFYLKGESWDMLGDDVFTCNDMDRTQGFDSPDIQSSLDLKGQPKDTNEMNSERLGKLTDISKSLQPDEVNDYNNFIQDYEDVKPVKKPRAFDFRMSATEITDTSAIIHWHGNAANLKHAFVQYYKFGHRAAALFAPIQLGASQYRLQNLQPGTNYIICIIPVLQGFPENPDLNNCVEVSTQLQASGFLPDAKTLDYHVKVLLASFLVSSVICSIGYLLYELCEKIYSYLYYTKEHTN